MVLPLLEKIKSNLDRFADRNAFYIRDTYFTYRQFKERILTIASRIMKDHPRHQQTIGVVTHDHIDTYASILAIWFTGNIFVPVNPKNPPDRIKQIIQQAGLRQVFVSDEAGILSETEEFVEFVPAGHLPPVTNDPGWPEINRDNILYLLFTSGSTGVPKGVPISLKNLDAFARDFIAHGYNFKPHDRFLQIYDLSFDGSLPCYVLPLITGACIFTVPQDEIRYLYALRLMQQHALSVIKMTPSTLFYLKPYFNEIKLDKVRYCLFGGEALHADLVKDWANCIPEAVIHNVYGPTEATIICMIYSWNRYSGNNQWNSILPIGKPLASSRALVVDSNLHPLDSGEKGELCIAGPQLMPGYWNDPVKDAAAFFELETEGRSERYYRTGDLVIRDEKGDYLFAGRLDEQVQIDGFRVELGEIEKHARDFTKLNNIAAISVHNEQGTNQIHLFVEGTARDREALIKYLESRLPYYMIPSSVQYIDTMPKSAGGKIQKSRLRNLLP